MRMGRSCSRHGLLRACTYGTMRCLCPGHTAAKPGRTWLHRMAGQLLACWLTHERRGEMLEAAARGPARTGVGTPLNLFVRRVTPSEANSPDLWPGDLTPRRPPEASRSLKYQQNSWDMQKGRIECPWRHMCAARVSQQGNGGNCRRYICSYLQSTPRPLAAANSRVLLVLGQGAQCALRFTSPPLPAPSPVQTRPGAPGALRALLMPPRRRVQRHKPQPLRDSQVWDAQGRDAILVQQRRYALLVCGVRTDRSAIYMRHGAPRAAAATSGAARGR